MGKTVFITGASSGIGRELAFEYAARGCDLVLTARRLDAMQAIRAEILAQHPHCRIEARALDVTQYAEVFDAIRAAAQAFGKLDCVIANAGIGGSRLVGTGHFETDRAVIETNVLGAMATLDAATALFREQGHGQLVAISSVAAFRGLPGSASYSASKAAITVYADALRTELYGTPIKLTTLFPGYIDTPINQEIARRPFLIDVKTGARQIADLIERGVAASTVPVFPWNLLKLLLKSLPTALLAKAVKPARG